MLTDSAVAREEPEAAETVRDTPVTGASHYSKPFSTIDPSFRLSDLQESDEQNWRVCPQKDKVKLEGFFSHF